MNRNAKLVFVALAFPAVIAITAMQVIGVLAGLSVLALSFTKIEPLRVIVYALIAFTGMFLATTAVRFGCRKLATVTMILAAIAVWKSEYLFRMVIPTAETLRLITNIPVTLTQTVSGNRILASFTNRSDNWLESVRVECQGFYRNGTPNETLWARNGRGNGHWLAPGESATRAKVFEALYEDRDRFDLSRTKCRLAHADFRIRPAHLPAMAVSLTETGRWRFLITNTTDSVINGIWISCRTEHGFRNTIPVHPAYQDTQTFVLARGSSLTLFSDTTRSDLRDCRIYALRTL